MPIAYCPLQCSFSFFVFFFSFILCFFISQPLFTEIASGHRLFAISTSKHVPNTNQMSYSTIKFERVGERECRAKKIKKKKSRPNHCEWWESQFFVVICLVFFRNSDCVLTKCLEYLSCVKWCGNTVFGIHINIVFDCWRANTPSIHPSTKQDDQQQQQQNC